MDIRKFFGAKKASAAPAAAPAASAPKGAAAAAPKSTPAGAEKRKKGSPPAQQGAGKKAKGAPEGSPEPTPVSSSQGSKGSESGSKSRFFGGSDKKPSPRASGASGRSAASPRPAVAYTAADEEADKGVAWKWQFHTQMKPFDAASTDKLNRGWKSYKAGRGGQSKMSITIRNEEYTIDFDQMDQTNVETGNKRTIKRIMPKPEPKPKPVKQEKVKQEKVAPAPAKASSSASAASAPAKPRASGGGNPNWRGGAGKAPPQQGLKHINKGAPNCLKNKCFLITGVLDSLDREDCEKLIQKYGGTISKSVPKKKKLDYAIIGEDAGPSKLKKLDEKPETKQIDENGLLTMLRDSLSPEDKAKEPEVGTMITPDLDIATVSVKGTSATPATNAANTASIAASAASAAAVASGPAPVKVPPNPAHSLWTEKYKPKTTKDLVGNFQVVNKVNNWLKVWSSPQSPPEKRAVLMAGPPGYGKTSMAHVMLNTVGYEVMEFNASDVRSKKAVGNQIEDITNSRSMSEFFSAGGKQVKKVAVIMDEVDGMSSGDRGGIQELIRIIVASKVPIICCCNDESHEKVRTLKKYW
jgi:replication factor C subunit 1